MEQKMDQIQGSRPKIVGIAVTMLYVTLGVASFLFHPTAFDPKNNSEK